MKPVKFKGSNCVYAEHQPEYLNLPAHKNNGGRVVTSCWLLSFWERLKIIFTGRVYVKTLTFHHPLQPQSLQTTNPHNRLKEIESIMEEK